MIAWNLKKTPKGFTLIELMVTIAVLAIIVTIAMPSFTEMMERQRLKNAVETFYSDLLFAKSEALKQSTDVTVSNVGNCLVATVNAGSETIAKACVANFPGVALASTGLPLIIDKTTGTSKLRTGATFTLTGSAHSAQITFARLGGVSICSGDGLGGYPGC